MVIYFYFQAVNGIYYPTPFLVMDTFNTAKEGSINMKMLADTSLSDVSATKILLKIPFIINKFSVSPH